MQQRPNVAEGWLESGRLALQRQILGVTFMTFGLACSETQLELAAAPTTVVLALERGGLSAEVFESGPPELRTFTRGAEIAALQYDVPAINLGWSRGRLELVDGARFPTAANTLVANTTEGFFVEGPLPVGMSGSGPKATSHCPFEPETLELELSAVGIQAVLGTRDGALVVTSTGPFQVLDGAGARRLNYDPTLPRGRSYIDPQSQAIWVIGDDGRTAVGSVAGPFVSGPTIPDVAPNGIADVTGSLEGTFELFVLGMDSGVWVMRDGVWSRLRSGGLPIGEKETRRMAWVGPGTVWVMMTSSVSLLEVGDRGQVEIPFVGSVSDPLEGPPEIFTRGPNGHVYAVTQGGAVVGRTAYVWNPATTVWSRHPVASPDPKALAFTSSGEPWLMGHQSDVQPLLKPCPVEQLDFASNSGFVGGGGRLWAFGTIRRTMYASSWGAE